MQRRLFSPNYDGPGKWVLFDPAARRSLLAVEQQDDFEQRALPRVLRLLLAAQRGERLDHDSVRQLFQAGLLVPGPQRPPGPTFLSRFQQSVYDYPFFDYSTSKTFQEDQQLMAKYEEDSPPPPAWTPRVGTPVRLPEVTWEDLRPAPDDVFGLRHLAAVLRFTFGPIGELPQLGARMHYRRTSPSGGAKHPTEGWLHIDRSWQGLSPGLYVYDCAHHILVLGDPSLATPPQSSGGPVTFSIRSRVERPMWRYRDGRSFRAVLIDAGHVIETLMALLGLFGVPARVQAGRRPTSGYGWLREPELAVVVPELDETARTAAPRAEPASGPGPRTSDPLVTNPGMFFTLEGGAFGAHVVHPVVRSFVADEVDFHILNHCLLSHRGVPHRPADRRNTAEAALAAAPGASMDRIERLCACGGLLSDDEGRPFYSEVRRWAERGWYQPLLTWLEASNADPEPGRSVTGLRLPVDGANLARALRQRVTTRGFARDPIDKATLQALLREGYQVDQQPSIVSAYVAVLDVVGLPKGSLHTWDAHSGRLVPTGRAITAADVIEATIGQQWLKNSAAAIWLVEHLDVGRPSTYFLSNILLGRMAQAMAIVATDRDLGVFQTPAVEDRTFAAKVGLPEDLTMTAYLICVGHRPGASGEHRR